MLSRVADAVHWMSRYIERAENLARFVDVNESLTLDLGSGSPQSQWRSLVMATGDDSEFLERYPHFDRENVLRFLVFDPSYHSSIWSSLRAARENARSVREIISADTWEQTNRAYHLVKKAAAAPDAILADPEPFLQKVKEACYRIDGSMQVTMTHNDAWYFMQVGRLLERADKTSRILDVKYFLVRQDAVGVEAEDDPQWSALLQSVSGLEMYRQKCGRITPAKALHFLLFETSFPRSIRFCVMRAEKGLQNLDAGQGVSPRNEVERRLGRLRAELEFAEVGEVMAKGVHEWVDGFQRKLNAVGVAMHETYFELGTPVGQRQSQSQG